MTKVFITLTLCEGSSCNVRQTTCPITLYHKQTFNNNITLWPMFAAVTNSSPLAYFMPTIALSWQEHSVCCSLSLTHSHTVGWDELFLNVESCLRSANSKQSQILIIHFILEVGNMTLHNARVNMKQYTFVWCYLEANKTRTRTLYFHNAKKL